MGLAVPRRTRLGHPCNWNFVYIYKLKKWWSKHCLIYYLNSWIGYDVLKTVFLYIYYNFFYIFSFTCFDQTFHKSLVWSGRVQGWTGLLAAGYPETQLRPVAPQASAVQGRAASFQTWPVPLVKTVYSGPPARTRPPLILQDEVSTLWSWASNHSNCRPLNFDCTI